MQQTLGQVSDLTLKMPIQRLKDLPKRAALMLASLAMCTAAAQAQIQPRELSFASRDGTPIKAWLYEPAGVGEAKSPLVVALHGCGGLYAATGPRQGQVGARHDAMAQILLADGYRVLFPDSFESRGEKELCTQPVAQRKINQIQRRVDALGALQWATQQPWGDAQRVALLGWSHGGSGVLAAVNAKHPATQGVPEKFAQAIAFYPGCAASESAKAEPNTKLAMMLGALDDWTPPDSCIRWGKAVNAEVNVYANAYHDFDNPQGRVRVRADVPNGISPGKGVTVGPNPAARKAAYERVRELLKSAFTKD